MTLTRQARARLLMQDEEGSDLLSVRLGHVCPPAATRATYWRSSFDFSKRLNLFE